MLQNEWYNYQPDNFSTKILLQKIFKKIFTKLVPKFTIHFFSINMEWIVEAKFLLGHCSIPFLNFYCKDSCSMSQFVHLIDFFHRTPFSPLPSPLNLTQKLVYLFINSFSTSNFPFLEQIRLSINYFLYLSRFTFFLPTPLPLEH